MATTSLNDLMNDPEYQFLFEKTAEEQEIEDKLFDMSRYENSEEQTLDESWNLLHGCEA